MRHSCGGGPAAFLGTGSTVTALPLPSSSSPPLRGAVSAGPHATVEALPAADGVSRGELRVVIAVPFQLESMVEVKLDISAGSLLLQRVGCSGGSSRQGHQEQELRVELPNGFELDPDLASAKFSRKKQQLVVSSPWKEPKPADSVVPLAPSPPAPPVPPLQAAAAEAVRGGQDTQNFVAALPAVSRGSAVERPVAQREVQEEEDEDDLPPPLEAARSAPHLEVPAAATATADTAERPGGVPSVSGETNAAANALMAQALAAREKKRKETEASRRAADLGGGSGSGGLKKGFLSQGASKPKRSAVNSVRTRREEEPPKEEAVPFISGVGSPEEARRQSLHLPGVQEALRQGVSKLKDDQSWVTPQLLNAMQARPDLLKGLSDPNIQQAIQLMQQDPEEAKKRFAGDPKVTAFLKEFTSLMATHFDVLGQGSGQKSSSKATAAVASGSGSSSTVSSNGGAMSTTPSSLSSNLALEPAGRGRPTAPLYTGDMPADDPVTKALSDPRVSEAFQDQEVQALLDELRRGRPLEMRDLCRDRPQLFFKVKVLLDAGLLNLQQ